MLIYGGDLQQQKIGAISQLGAEKITFPPKRGCHTDRRTDICFYRVALLLKKIIKGSGGGIPQKSRNISVKCI